MNEDEKRRGGKRTWKLREGWKREGENKRSRKREREKEKGECS